jgi:hypothetical protein
MMAAIEPKLHFDKQQFQQRLNYSGAKSQLQKRRKCQLEEAAIFKISAGIYKCSFPIGAG